MLSIGTDIIEISRIKKSLDRYGVRFLSYVYSDREQMLYNKNPNNINFLAGRFAAKEAIYKALNAEMSYGIGWKDMEILRGFNGGPYIELSGLAQERAKELNIQKMHISLSHCKEYAVAFVSIE